ncbi:MAG TPA: hypothetical protein VG826_29195 [Pirellulales bacterium]|nr:hypothetical protein [Pirellulales bacterium]
MNPRTLMQAAFTANAQDPEVFGTVITHYPLGRTAGETVTAVLHGAETVSSAVDNDYGSEVEIRMRITLPSTVTVTVAERPQERDTFLVNGELWIAEAVIWRSTHRQHIEIKRSEKASTKRTRLH